MARYLIVADIHSNLVAFDAVLKDADVTGGFDRMWVLGDIVGYGPEPAECIARVIAYPHVCIAGNHDLAVSGAIDLAAFNAEAARACLWTRCRLGVQAMGFLRKLPTEAVEPPFLLVHGSPRDPLWEYLTSAGQAARALNLVRVSTHCMVGHTHQPAVYRLNNEEKRVSTQRVHDGMVVHLDNERLLLNPG
ncbi:MAG: metallophosphoesterase family protein, partial [Chloroflexota bacterium]